MSIIRKLYEKQLMKVAALEYLCNDEENIKMAYQKEGHSGPGYYFWDVEYPEDGSVLVSAKDVAKFYLPFLFKKDKEEFYLR